MSCATAAGNGALLSVVGAGKAIGARRIPDLTGATLFRDVLLVDSTRKFTVRARSQSERLLLVL